MSLVQCGPPGDPYSTIYPPTDLQSFPGFYGHSGTFGDYDEYVENLSRPRLTKEQVETLEAQFQAHPKPNSNIKRQLAMQTNLTLPRVAVRSLSQESPLPRKLTNVSFLQNWFQNRRAKAKQQKRQEEFEKMQAIKNPEILENEVSRRSRDVNRDYPREKGLEDGSTVSSTDQALKRTPSREQNTILDPVPSKTHSEQSCPALEESAASPFEKLPAPTAIEGCQDKKAESIANPTSCGSAPKPDNRDSGYHPGLAGVEPVPLTWTTSSHNTDFFKVETADLDRHTAPQQGTEFTSPRLWPGGPNPVVQPIIQLSYSACEARSKSFDTASCSIEKPSIHPFPATRKFSLTAADSTGQSCESYFPVETDHSKNINQQEGLPETSEPVAGLHGPHASTPASETFPYRRDKKLDLAARRKQPRPAAIGINGPKRSPPGPSSTSPTTRVCAWGTAQSLRHVKSSQNLGSSLSPRYAGVRKVSAPLRSPLGAAATLEFAGPPNTDYKVPPLITTNMAPHTPLTPEDLQYLLPPTPVDAHYCLSPTDETRGPRLFPMPQSMCRQSSPSTPYLPNDPSQLHYYSAHTPPSASLNTAYENFSPSVANCAHVIGPWTHATLVSEESLLSSTPMCKPSHFCPISQTNTLGHPVGSVRHDWSADFVPPVSTLSQPVSFRSARRTDTDFITEEFPNQQEYHRFAAQNFLSEKPKNYTFTNHTSNDF